MDISHKIRSSLQESHSVDSFCDKLVRHCNPKDDSCPAMNLLYSIRHYSLVCREVDNVSILESNTGFSVLRSELTASELDYHNSNGNSIYNLPFNH